VIPTSNQDGRQAKNRKKGDEIKKNSSPLKQVSQSQPNFAEMILGWSFWLKIEQFSPYEEISIFSNGGHIGYRTALTDTILKNRNFFIWPKLLYFKPECAQI
jgi:hypothetical protein